MPPEDFSPSATTRHHPLKRKNGRLRRPKREAALSSVNPLDAAPEQRGGRL
jgi:hypothetical protein